MVSDSSNGSNRGGVIETVKDNLKPLGVIVLGIAASIYLGLTLNPEKPNLPRYEPFDSQNGSYQPSASQCSPAALLAIRDVRKRATKSDDCADQAEDYRLKANDLIQQSRAADAAQAQAVLAYDQAWVALWATLGGLWTLIAAGLAAAYARDAAREGWRSANAAECTLTETENANRLTKEANANAVQQAKEGSADTRRALKIASQNAEAAFDAAKAMTAANEIARDAQRPWVTIDLKVEKIDFRNGHKFWYELIFTNVGQSVAQKFHFYNEIGYFCFAESGLTDKFIDEAKEEIAGSKVVIAPRDSFRYPHDRCTTDHEAIIIRDTATGLDGYIPIIMVAAFYKIHADQTDWNCSIKCFRLESKQSKSYFARMALGGRSAGRIIGGDSQVSPWFT